MAIPEIVRNNLVVSIVAGLFGALITAVVAKLHSKTARLRYSVRVEKIATSADDPIFGSVKTTWGNSPVRNLYMATVEIENSSTRDFENAEFKIYTAKDTFILNESGQMANKPYAVLWSPSYRQSLTVPTGKTPSPTQQETYHHTREYQIPVFNRADILHLNYLCTRPNDDVVPGIWVGTQIKGARLDFRFVANVIFGVPVQDAAIRGLVISAITVVVSGFYLHNIWFASGISAFIAAGGQIWGAGEYKVERWLWKALTR